MDNLIITNDKNYKDIADAIRQKSGGSDLYSPSDMAEAITNIPGGGDHSQLTNRDAANQHPISSITGLSDELDDKQDKVDTDTVTISVADWAGGTTCTKSVTGVTATSIVIVETSDGGVECTGQGAGTLTFTANSTPTSAVTVKVVILAGEGSPTPQREWTETWYFYPTDNTIGSTYETISGLPYVMQYPNKVCKAVKGDTIVINADTTKLTKLDILELYPLTVFTSTTFSGIIISKVNVQTSQFVGGKYTYTATNDNCAGIGFRFKAISDGEGQALADSILFKEGI